jgi:hypothetical protein
MGLRKLRTTVIRHLLASKKLSERAGGLFLVQEYAKKHKNDFTQRR